MTNLRRLTTAALIGLWAAALQAAPAAAPAGAPTGEGFAHTCAACHGTYGRLKGEAFPPLAGMKADEFARSMRDFRDLRRPSSIMSHIAEGYTDEEIARMAEWFAAQTAE